MRVTDVLQGPGEATQGRRTRLQVTSAPGLLPDGAVLLMCAPVLPGLSRLVVLPTLPLARGCLKDAGIERDFRDGVASTIYSGTSEIKRDGTRPDAPALSPMSAAVSGGEPGREA